MNSALREIVLNRRRATALVELREKVESTPLTELELLYGALEDSGRQVARWWLGLKNVAGLLACVWSSSSSMSPSS